MVTPMSDNGNASDGYLFLQQGVFSIFIERYCIVKEETSTDWSEYFKVYVFGGLRLQVYGGRNPVYLKLPVLEQEWFRIKGTRKLVPFCFFGNWATCLYAKNWLLNKG